MRDNIATGIFYLGVALVIGGLAAVGSAVFVGRSALSGFLVLGGLLCVFSGGPIMKLAIELAFGEEPEPMDDKDIRK